ncbi:MAG: YHS domain-containing protein, partial [Nitrospirae bacterium]|nr:YHS domain-containing protein [Nitrospirota bacterium]
MAIDPICGMTVDPATAAGSHDHRSQRYYFCSLSCLERFKADPERVLQPQLVSVAKPTTRRPLPMMQPAPAVMGQTAVDPVCGMTVQPATAAGSYEYQGKTYYFCAASCLAKFRAEPIYYLTPPEQRAPRIMPDTSGGVVEYICPMDPEVLETKPGACRICGMALEPKVVSLEDERNPELDDMTRRFW